MFEKVKIFQEKHVLKQFMTMKAALERCSKEFHREKEEEAIIVRVQERKGYIEE